MIYWIYKYKFLLFVINLDSSFKITPIRCDTEMWEFTKLRTIYSCKYVAPYFLWLVLEMLQDFTNFRSASLYKPDLQLTHWRWDKTAVSLETFSNGFPSMMIVVFWFKISVKLLPRIPILNVPALVQIMVWRRTGDKPLFEPMMASYTDVNELIAGWIWRIFWDGNDVILQSKWQLPLLLVAKFFLSNGIFVSVSSILCFLVGGHVWPIQ